jgi:L-cysteine S-thiosulfotransferase
VRPGFLCSLLLGACAATAIAGDGADAVIQRAEQVMRESFTSATPEQWKTRLAQDQTQALCSRYHNAPPTDAATSIVVDALGSMRYPESGKLLGNWKEGEKLASISTGGHIGRLQPDPPDRKRGGNCYACHALAATEIAAGTLGPSLTGYGKLHGNSPDAIKFVYEKIYNAQATFPCSLMPRFGHNAWLTPEQIADTVAFLLDPDSPVNK